MCLSTYPSLCGLDIRMLLKAYLRQGACSSPSSEQVIMTNRPVLLVSACLLGEPVNYRGVGRASHQQRCTPVGFLVDFLSRQHDLLDCIAVCPEMDLLGLPSPRPPLRLLRDPQTGRRSLVACGASVLDIPLLPNTLTSRDNVEGRLGCVPHRDPRLVDELTCRKLSGVHGCLFKARSPSCGVGDARLYSSVSGGVYSEVDGFFVESFLRPSLHSFDVPLPLVSDHQLFFDGEEFHQHRRTTRRRNSCGVLAFLSNILTRFMSCGSRGAICASNK
uniref:Uncharacterized protein TCIL3000_11_5620 n=1 Tax=Trypanosoma congolense (strain IL3000) TaxID=1068625 RepID=G0V0H7_TRYCI|nr:unnamed protein product [Trypanosoma congolense IL3000]